MPTPSSVEAVCVDPKEASKVWDHVAPLIKEAFDRQRGDTTLGSTQADVLSGRALLWLAWNGKEILAAAVTELRQSSAAKTCIVVAVGGRCLDQWRDCIKAIENFAIAEGCDAIRIGGRRGWKRVFKDYDEAWITLEKQLK